MKNVLVTGGAGFIGANFILYMLKEHDDIAIVNLDKLTYAGNLENLAAVARDPRHIFVQGDICDAPLVTGLFEKYNIDTVVNFAAETHVDRCILDPDIFVRTNILGTQTLLNAAKAAWMEGDTPRAGTRFHQVSTDEVYGSLGAEGFFTEATPIAPRSPYSASKAGADMLVLAYGETFGLPVSVTRCSNNYGPFQFPEKLIPLMIHNAQHKKPLPIYGDGLNVRDWLYVDDHCKAIDLVITKGKAGQVYNVGGHNERTNITIVKTIIAYLHAHYDAAVDEGLITYVADRKGHDRRYAIDPAKIKADLGWYPETDFESGIARTIDWYVTNAQWLDHVTSGEYEHYYKTMYGDK